jgi:hypothetical protein
MRDAGHWTAPLAQSPKALKHAAGFAAIMVALLVGAADAWADTSTGFTFRITCGSETAVVVSPTGPAAVGQDTSSTKVFILSYGALQAPGRFPVGKVMLCDLENLTTGDFFEDLPFLIQGAP